MLKSLVKSCSRCKLELPITAFRIVCKLTGRRAPFCRKCHARAETERTRKKRVRGLNRYITALQKSPESAIGLTVSALIEHLGGTEKFVQLWIASIDTATPNRRLRSFEALGKLLAWCESRTKEEFRTLSQDELESSMDFEIERAIQRDPRLAVGAAIKLGWQVIPPSSSR